MTQYAYICVQCFAAHSQNHSIVLTDWSASQTHVVEHWLTHRHILGASLMKVDTRQQMLLAQELMGPMSGDGRGQQRAF